MSTVEPLDLGWLELRDLPIAASRSKRHDNLSLLMSSASPGPELRYSVLLISFLLQCKQSSFQFQFIELFLSISLSITAIMAGKAHKSLNGASQSFRHSEQQFINIRPVFQKPLGLFSKEPMTGFYGNGYCDVGPDDTGNHSVAGTATFIRRPSTTQLTSCSQQPSQTPS
jgi:hypothetical protein